MHAKDFGVLGELKVATDLVRQGYQVFKELGDNSKIDLIAVDSDYNTWKIQVKCRSVDKHGAVKLDRFKWGPNYKFQYMRKHADIYAVYIPETDQICYVPASILMSKSRRLTIRVTDAKSNQREKVNYASDFLDLKRALRDCTQDIPPSDEEDDDPVQTTNDT